MRRWPTACTSSKTDEPFATTDFADWDALVSQFETIGRPMGATDPAEMTAGEASYIGMLHGDVEDATKGVKATLVADLTLTYDLAGSGRPLTSGRVYNLRTDLPGFETPTGEIILTDGELREVSGGTALQPGFGAPEGDFTQGSETLNLDLDTSYSGDLLYGSIGQWAEGEIDMRLWDKGGSALYSGLDAQDDAGRWIANRD